MLTGTREGEGEMVSSRQERREETREAEADRRDPGPKGLEQYRATAQQNAVDAIRAAEERYDKAKDSGADAASKAKESAEHALAAVGSKLSEIKERTGMLAADAVSGAGEKGRKAKDYVSEKAGAVKQSVKETAHQAVEYAGQKAAETKQKVGEQTKATQEKLKAMTIGGEDKEGEETKGSEDQNTGRVDVQEAAHLEQACKATQTRATGEEERTMTTTMKEGDQKCEPVEEGGEGRVKLVRVERGGGGGGGILRAVGETVVGIMQTARDMIVGKD